MTAGERSASSPPGSSVAVERAADDASAHDRRKGFWTEESVKFSRPWYRVEKSARIVRRLAGDKTCRLLDVGCGPAALQQLMPSNVHYYGLDIAVQTPAPNLMECDFVEEPIKWHDHERFDIVVAQGVFEYAGSLTRTKLREIRDLMTDGGFLLVTYTNFAHRRPYVYDAYTNVVPMEDFVSDVRHSFQIVRSFPASYNWNHGQPHGRLNQRINMAVNRTLPVVGRRLAVEYFFLCRKMG